jgi:3-hydroxyacyl-[acyl-carrier-protein] dehydratase
MRHFWVDRIVELEVGVRAVGVKSVALSEDVFTDHFPGNPVFPGIYLLEGLAQTAGALLERTTEGRRFGLMTSIDRVRFGAFVRPGDQVTYEIVIEALEEGHARVRGEATVAGRSVAAGRISFALVETERIIPPDFLPFWRHGLELWHGHYPEPADG